MVDVKQTLISARKLIEDKGLSHGNYVNFNGCHCTVGSIVKIIKPETKMTEYGKKLAVPEIRSAVNVFATANNLEIESIVYTAVYNFNDTHSQEQVLRAFDKAIESC